MNGQPCKKDLLTQIYAVSFAALDSGLYLNTHPCDQDALNYFYEMNKQRGQLMREYVTYYGPLTLEHATGSCTDRWNWINEPWPWQEGGC